MPDIPHNQVSETLRADSAQADIALGHIRQALVGLRYGQVIVVLQDGVIVQLERTERKRFQKHER